MSSNGAEEAETPVTETELGVEKKKKKKTKQTLKRHVRYKVTEHYGYYGIDWKETRKTK